MTNWISTLLLLISAYLVGSIPMGFIVGKIFYHVDIRTAGSGNIGATNALRLFGTRTGIIILILDMLKGLGVVLASKALLPAQSPFIVLAALVVILGHIFTIFLGFKGGKGVATAAGAFLGLAPAELGLGLVIFIAVVAIFRYVSLGSCTAALFFGLLVVLRQVYSPSPDWVKAGFCVFVVILIIFKHKANIMRLLQGNENRLSFTKKGSL